MTEFTAEGIDRTTILKVSGLTCGHCVTHITEEIEALPGVKNVFRTAVQGRPVDGDSCLRRPFERCRPC